MNKLWKYIQFGYIIIAIILFIEGILRFSDDKNKAYLYFGFSLFLVLIFFLKRFFRKKVDKRNQQNLR
jgi:L-asparagine transporter-like permease